MFVLGAGVAGLQAIATAKRLGAVVRAFDIGPGNVVPSTAIGQMRIRYFGRGLIKDNLQPGWLIRVLNKIF